MKRVVILQPQFLPWRGVFEQIRLSDEYIHLDDVALPQGRSFISRVQIKTAQGPAWLTVPIRKGAQHLVDIKTDDSQPWRKTHLKTLHNAYARAPHADAMLELAHTVYALETDSLCEWNIHAIETISKFLNLRCTFSRASTLPSTKKSTERLVEIACAASATQYLTGHGALSYLSPEPFERNAVQVEVMDYRRSPYPQLFEGFDPHVSVLDLIANTGTEAPSFLDSPSLEWRHYERNRKISA